MLLWPWRWFFLGIVACLGLAPAPARCQEPDLTKKKPAVLLRLDGMETDPAKIDYAKLPVVKGKHAVISPMDPQWKFQLHNYLIHHEGRFWCMWSHGPAEDEPPQHIRFATSMDGLKWSEPMVLAGPPKEGYAYIARGFWLRDGELLALVAFFKGKGAFGVNKELQLQAFAWDGKADAWRFKGKVFDNAINSFPPQKLPTGDWMLTRRDSRFNTSMLVGGLKALDDWRSIPIVGSLEIKGFRPDEPHWYDVPGKRLLALFRDNGGSSRLYQAYSSDNAGSWSTPVPTNFPNATSKFFSIRTSRGFRVLVSNANPTVGRRQLHLSLSETGEIYSHMVLLDIPSTKPATLQYPHVIEHDGQLLIPFSRNKAMIELLIVSLEALEPFRQQGLPKP
jgi:hypothetical protein